jgi:hypothetical protein
MPVPPVVRYRVTGGPAYLMAWGRRPDRSWWAQLVWIETTSEGCRGARAWVDAGDVQKMPGQDYRKVTRKQIPAHPGDRPTDPTDPRDPGRLSRAADRERIDRQRPRVPEPDF